MLQLWADGEITTRVLSLGEYFSTLQHFTLSVPTWFTLTDFDFLSISSPCYLNSDDTRDPSEASSEPGSTSLQGIELTPTSRPAHDPDPDKGPNAADQGKARDQELRRQATLEGAVELLGTRDPDAYAIQAEHQRKWKAWGLAKSYLNDEIEHTEAYVPLAWQAFLTGMVDMLLYSRSAVWLGFQTGNMVQFSSNIAQFIIPGAETQPLLTLLRILSVIGFFMGSFMGFQLGRRLGHQKRSWLILSSLIQSAFLFGGAGILLSLPQDAHPTFEWYPGVIVLVAFSMGMQSILAQKLVSPAFATTVAFTATLTQVASDPYLFHLIPSEKTRGRDRRMLAIVALCMGAGVGESLLHTSANLSGGLAISAGFKVVLSLLWLIPEGKKSGPVKGSKA